MEDNYRVIKQGKGLSIIKESGVCTIQISSDMKYLAVGWRGSYISVHDFHSGELVWRKRTYGESMYVGISPDIKFIVSVSYSVENSSKTIKLWDINDGTLISRFKNPKGIISMAITPVDKYLIIGGKKGRVYVWDYIEQNLIYSSQDFHNKKWIIRIGPAPDGNHVVSASTGKIICVWDFKNGMLIHQIDKAHSRNVSDVAFSPDMKYFVTASIDKTIKVWDFSSGDLISTFTSSQIHKFAGISSIAVSPDGRYILAGTSNKKAMLWNLETEELILTLKVDGGTLPQNRIVGAVKFSPDGKFLVCGSYGQNPIKVWDISAICI